MNWLQFFKLNHKSSASIAKERLQVVVAGHPPDGGGPGLGHRLVVLEAQVARLAEPHLVATVLGGQHQRKRRIARDLDAGQWIHDEEQLHEEGPRASVGGGVAGGESAATPAGSFIGNRCSRPCLRKR